jgi:hypothetical protein
MYDEDDRTVEVNPGDNNDVQVYFEYNADFDELTVLLVDLIDSMVNFDFRNGKERNTNTAWFDVIKI